MTHLQYKPYFSGGKLKEPPRIHNSGDAQTTLRGTAPFNTGDYLIKDYPKYYSGVNQPPPGMWSYGPGSIPRTCGMQYGPKPNGLPYVVNNNFKNTCFEQPKNKLPYKVYERGPQPDTVGKVSRVENFEDGYVTDSLQPNRHPYYNQISAAVAPTLYSKINSNTTGMGNALGTEKGRALAKTNNRFMYTPLPEHIITSEANINNDLDTVGSLQAAYPQSLGLEDSGSRYGLPNYDQVSTFKYTGSPSAPGYGIDNVNDRYESIGGPYSARNLQWNPKQREEILKYYYNVYEPTNTDSHSVQFNKFKNHLKYATPKENADAINFYKAGVMHNNNVVPYGHVVDQGRLVDCTKLPPLPKGTLCTDDINSDSVYAKCEAQAQYLGRVPHRSGGYCSLDGENSRCGKFGIGKPFLNNKKLIKNLADSDRAGFLLNEVPHKLESDPEYKASGRILSGAWSHSRSLKTPGMVDYWQNYSFNPVNGIKWNMVGAELKRKY